MSRHARVLLEAARRAGGAARRVRGLVVGLRRTRGRSVPRDRSGRAPGLPLRRVRSARVSCSPHTFHHALRPPMTVRARLQRVRAAPGRAASSRDPQFIERLLAGKAPPVFGDGLSERDFVFVDDARRRAWCARDRERGFALINVAGGRTLTLLELVAVLERELGVAAESRQPARPATCGAPGATLGRAGGARLRAGARPRARALRGRTRLAKLPGEDAHEHRRDRHGLRRPRHGRVLRRVRRPRDLRRHGRREDRAARARRDPDLRARPRGAGRAQRARAASHSPPTRAGRARARS